MQGKLEERLTLLEAEVAQIKSRMENSSSLDPWWERIVGTFANSTAYDEAMQLGQEYRNSLRVENDGLSQDSDVHS